MKVLFLYPNLQLMQIMPAGITSLSSYLKSKNIEVDIFDTTFYKLAPRSSDEERIDSCQVRPFKFEESGVHYKNSDILQDFYTKVEKFKPDVLAISCNDFTQNIASYLIEDFKPRHPDIHVIMGGVFPMFSPHYAIQNPNVDSICVAEGYEALHELVVKLGNKEDITKIPNLWVKSGGEIHTNTIKAPVNIDDIPFDDFDLFEEKRFYRPMQGRMLKMLPVWLDLGCPYQCKYCIAPTIRESYKQAGHNYLRVKSVDRIISELNYQINKHKPNYIYFSTETFFARPDEHIIKFAEYYKKFIKLPFWCETRAEGITMQRARLLKDMGCDRLSMGFESGNEKYRTQFLKKTFTNQQFCDSFKILQEVGIKTTINNIIGMPEETREMIFDTINYNRMLNRIKKCDVTMTVSTFVPCGGSGLQQYCIDKGYFDLQEYYQMSNTSFHKGCFLKQPSISQDEIKGLLRTFPLYVKLPRNYYPMIEKAERLDKKGDKFFKELKETYWEVYAK